VEDAEVRFVLELSRLLELGVCALLLQHLVYEGLVGGLGEPALLIQQGEDPRGVGLRKRNKKHEFKRTHSHADAQRRGSTDRPLDEVDAGLQVQAEVDEAPLDALPLVLLLLQDEHGVVEELLQLLVGVVDAQLLEGVQLEGSVRKTCVMVLSFLFADLVNMFSLET